METDVYWSIKRWLFDVKSTLLDTEAKDADDVTGLNDGSAIIGAVGSKDDLQQSTWVCWADPIATTTVMELEAEETVTQIASVTQSG